MKNIYQMVENVSDESGGVRTVLVNLDNYIKESDFFSSTIITNKKEISDNYREFLPTSFNSWCYSNEIENYLDSKINDIDIFHIHGAFMHIQYLTSKKALQNHIPYVITPHGMLEPWHLKDKRIKKKIYFDLILSKILKKSNAIHAITPIEKENLFNLTGHKNIVEIPNFIHYSKVPNTLEYKPDNDYLLFLSRLHPKKGLDILIQSMSRINDKKIKLKIVGSENTYSNSLKKMIADFGLENRIEFLGSIYGNEKYNLFANARVFIAPSYSEAIGMVNLEAAACKTPVITSFNTGISPEWNHNGGIMLNPNVEELTSAINKAITWSDEERTQRGIELSRYVFENYSWEKKGYLWKELYSSIKKD